MKTALIHDWLLSHGGSEEVFQAIHTSFPGDIYTLAKDSKILSMYDFPQEKVFSSFIEKFPSIEKYFKYYLPFFPYAVEQFDLRKYDIILSSSHCVAKGVLTNHEQLHICYCHTPMRYAWDMYHAYLEDAKLTRGIKGWLAQTFLHKLRMWDFASAQRVDHFIANSSYIARRIKKLYGRDATVIYPPVDIDTFALCSEKEDYYVTASRLVPYKKIDLIVDAFNAMPTKKLLVIGSGEMQEKLQKKAGANITFLGYIDTKHLVQYLQNAKAFVFAALEDFGILPVQAQSCGTPVICLGRGGTMETVIHGKTGIHFQKQTANDIQKAVEQCETHTFDPNIIRTHALKFSKAEFSLQFTKYVEDISNTFFHA